MVVIGEPSISERIINLCRDKGEFYVVQLACLKRCFGPQSTMGCVVEGGKTVQCGTIADLHRIGWASDKLLHMDRFLRRIVRIGDKGWKTN